MTVSLPPIDTERLIADRRDFHAHPELAYEEHRTAGIVAERLETLGYDVRTGVGRTGVVGTRGNAAGRCVLLRADMDALPVEEANEVPYRSRAAGKMHACGHDGHIAVGLEVATRLAAVDLPGTVRFAFQPAEEGGNGAGAMIEDGVMDAPPVDAAFGMHLWSYLPAGTIGITSGPIFSSADAFEITIHGRGGHAAIPQHAVDPIIVAAHVVTAMQTLVSRRRDPLEAAVVSVTSVQAGEAFNVIPETARLLGTVRTYGGAIHADMPTLMTDLVTHTAQAFGATATVEYRRLLPVTTNDPVMTALMADIAEDLVGTDAVRRDVRTLASEDMGLFLNHAPGCYALVGSGNPAKKTDQPHHSPNFNIDEDVLPLAVELLSRTAATYLEGG